MNILTVMSGVAPAILEDRHVSVRWALVPLGLALLAGGPTIRGTFLPGDDVQLLRDHVLVNRPSLDHLVKLFAVPHRDLYQPVPLATFSAEFWIMRRLGLSPDADGLRPGAWINHLGNILIHAANALLVFALLWRLAQNRAFALIAASLFAIHPLNAQCVAWLSGRMIMLSTLFTLAALLAADVLLARKSAALIVAVLASTLLAMMSKISIGLPVLLLLVPWVRRERPSRRWWGAFAGATLLTVAFVALNVYISRRQLATAEQAFEGSRWARTLISLGWYLTHYLIPTGLAPWHPADAVVTFADPRALPAALALVVLLVVAWVIARHTRQGGAALVWFFAAIAAMLPLIPSRNVLVAERYLYLPGIGLHWLLGLVATAIAGRIAMRLRRGSARTLGGVTAVVAAAGLLALAWRHAADYRDNVARYRRIAALYPDRNQVWPALAWALYDAGQYDEAIATAESEIKLVARPARSDVLQVQGMALLRAGKPDEARATLEAAVAADPHDEMAYLRLATAEFQTGRFDAAAAHFRRSAELMPNYNHALIGLAQTLRKLDQPDEAATAFERALVNNPHDPTAIVALAELELLRGDLRPAAERLESLLTWMPENAAARANLGVCYLRLGRTSDAEREFNEAIACDPTAIEPRLNLAELLAATDRPEQADAAFNDVAQRTGYGHLPALEAYSDFLIERGDLRAAAALWTSTVEANPGNPIPAAWYAWVSALAGRWDLAGQAINAQPGDAYVAEPVALTKILLHLRANEPETAIQLATLLIERNTPQIRATRRLQVGLHGFSERYPESPWPYYLVMMALKTDGELASARLALHAFEARCADASWRARARGLLEPGIDTQPTTGQNARP